MTDKIYVGDVGTEIILDCGVDISSATVKNIQVKKPDGTLATWSADIYNTNYLKHTVVTGELDIKGNYSVQSYIESASWSGRGEVSKFRVYDVFE